MCRQSSQSHDSERDASGEEPSETRLLADGSGSDLRAAFDGEPAFVPYLAVGDPDYESSLAYVEALERGGADAIELGLPFSEPIAEGSTIQEAVVRSLDAGMTPERFFEFVADLDVDVPLVCMTYYNLLYQYGGDEAESGPRPFVERAAAVGLSGFVVPDLPAEEAGPLREACDEFGLDLVSIVAPTTEDERLEKLVDISSGYLYVQARLGVTGADVAPSDRTAESLERLGEYDIPKAVGFGISDGEQAAEIVSAGADGIIVGSALVEIVADGYEHDRPTDDVAADLEALASELKAGARRGGEQAVPRPDGS
jgi:tryptophan synthase alpha chain